MIVKVMKDYRKTQDYPTLTMLRDAQYYIIFK
jgi:hypothetical protein